MKPYNERCWINGYEWGVEYETNGEKPDLPDDVEVEWASHAQWVRVDKVCNLEWGKSDPYCVPITKFRIVDERYRPKFVIEFIADSMKIQTPNGVYEDVIDLINKGLNEMNNDWYKKGELPPANTECEVRIDGQWLPTVVIGHYAMEAVVVDPCVTVQRFFCTTANNLRPIRTETDKLVEQAMSLFSKTESTTDAKEGIEHAVRKLIEQGYRKVKLMSRDEVISKIFGLADHLGMADAATLYDAGCRFIDKGGNDE